MTNTPIEVQSYADLVTLTLHKIHTYALRNVIHDADATGLDYLYGNIPMPDEDVTNGMIELLTDTFTERSTMLAQTWETLVEQTVKTGVTDALQIIGVRRWDRNRIRREHVTNTQAFWLAFWNTYQ